MMGFKRLCSVNERHSLLRLKQNKGKLLWRYRKVRHMEHITEKDLESE
jgi:hypothetical protein